MFVSDNLIFVSVLLLALIFTLGALDFPLRTAAGRAVVAGEMTSYIRIIIFPYLAAIMWFIMAAFANSLNNCYSGFGGAGAGCFTSPTTITTTSTIYPDAAGQIMYYPFFGLFAGFLVMGIAFTFYFAFRPLQSQMEAPGSSPV